MDISRELTHGMMMPPKSPPNQTVPYQQAILQQQQLQQQLQLQQHIQQMHQLHQAQSMIDSMDSYSYLNQLNVPSSIFIQGSSLDTLDPSLPISSSMISRTYSDPTGRRTTNHSVTAQGTKRSVQDMMYSNISTIGEVRIAVSQLTSSHNL